MTIIHGWEKPLSCLECPFKVREEWRAEYDTTKGMYACMFALRDYDEDDCESVDPWHDGRWTVSHKLYIGCPIEEVEE